MSPAADIREKGWRAVIDLNLTGTFLMTQRVYNRAFDPQKRGSVSCGCLSTLSVSLGRY